MGEAGQRPRLNFAPGPSEDYYAEIDRLPRRPYNWCGLPTLRSCAARPPSHHERSTVFPPPSCSTVGPHRCGCRPVIAGQ
jgi:hypothetical protein